MDENRFHIKLKAEVKATKLKYQTYQNAIRLNVKLDRNWLALQSQNS